MEEITSKTSLQMKFRMKQVASEEDETQIYLFYFFKNSNLEREISTKMKHIIMKLNLPKHIITHRIN
jgi:hypothetical protein